LNVTFIASIFLQFLINLSLKHLTAVKQTIKYLYSLQYVGIKYRGVE